MTLTILQVECFKNNCTRINSRKRLPEITHTHNGFSGQENLLLSTKEEEKGASDSRGYYCAEDGGLACLWMNSFGKPLMLTCELEAKLPGYWNLESCQ